MLSNQMDFFDNVYLTHFSFNYSTVSRLHYPHTINYCTSSILLSQLFVQILAAVSNVNLSLKMVEYSLLNIKVVSRLTTGVLPSQSI